MVFMSSIICNIGQVELENEEWQQASIEFQKALEIQEKKLNGAVAADNDVLLATRENLAYSAIKYGSYDFAKQIYKEILYMHECSNEDAEEAETKRDQTKRDELYAKEALVMRNIAFTHIKLYEYDDALERIDDVQETHPNLRPTTKRKIKRLKSTLHYHNTKYPAAKELFLRTITGMGCRSGWNNDILCKCGGETDADEIDLRIVMPKRPSKGTKMSGHKVSFS